MDSKNPKLTLDEWIAFCKSLKYGDELHCIAYDLSGKVIMFFSEDNGYADPKHAGEFVHPAHTFRYLGLGRGATVEADPKGTQYHLIDEYRDRVMAGDVRLIVHRHLDLTVDDFDKIKQVCEMEIKRPYSWGAIIGFGLVRLFQNTFIGGIWRWAKWQTPFCSADNPVCSQGVRLQKNAVKRYFDVMQKLSDWTANTPQMCLDQTGALTTYVGDTHFE